MMKADISTTRNAPFLQIRYPIGDGAGMDDAGIGNFVGGYK